jgi:hypothetical protein
MIIMAQAVPGLSTERCRASSLTLATESPRTRPAIAPFRHSVLVMDVPRAGPAWVGLRLRVPRASEL